MGKSVELTAVDGHRLAAYVAEPEVAGRAGLVVIQEIFGVNPHIRRVTDGFAAEGYLAIAPSLFDRVEKDIELGYDEEQFKKGREIVGKIPVANTVSDIAAAVEWLRAQPGIEKVGVVGYCWGGSLAWLANTRLEVDATVSYYGAQIGQYITEKAGSPAIFHFGEHDAHIPPELWAKIEHEYPGFPVFVYDADHGFNCDARASYNAEAAKLALGRTLAHLDEHLLQEHGK